MSETITTTQLLDFLAKAAKVSSHVTVTQVTNFYLIAINAAWDDNNNFYTKSTYITAAGHSTWDSSAPGDYDFFTMSNVLNELVKREEEMEIKRQKRQELLSRLTDEEKELLYLES